MAWLIGVAIAILGLVLGLGLGALLVGALAAVAWYRIGNLERRVADLDRLRQAEAAGRAPETTTDAGPRPQPMPPPPAAAPAPRMPAPPGADAPSPAAARLRMTPEPRAVAAPAASMARSLRPSAAVIDSIAGRSAGRAGPTLADLEQLLAGRALALAGGLALVIGIVFFLGLAFSRGWIGPEMRVLMGLAAGTAAFAGGAFLLGGRQRTVGHVLLAVGVAAVNLALFASTRLYGLVPVEFGLAGALVAAAAAALVAASVRSQVVAVYGLVAVLAAPPVMGAAPTVTTIAFLGVALIGTTALAIARDWRWLPPTAFVLTAPQLAVYLLGDVEPISGLTALGGFWLLHVLAASGEELRRRTGEPSPTSATVFLSSAGLLMWGGFTVLDGAFEPWRGAFLVAVAVAHLAIGFGFLRREHDQHAYTLLALGTGVAAITMAVPIQFGGAAVPIVWSAEAAALTWIAARRRHRYSAGAAAVLGALAVGHLVTIEYGLDRAVHAAGIPFVNGAGAALLFVLVAGTAAGWLSRDRLVRLWLAGAAVALLAYGLLFELNDPLARALAWLALAVATVVVTRRMAQVTLRAPLGTPDAAIAAGRAPYAAAAFALALAAWVTVVELLPLSELDARIVAASFAAPFDAGSAMALVSIVVALALPVAVGVRAWSRASVLAAAGVAAYGLPFDVPAAWTVVGWSLIGGGLLAVDRRDRWDGYLRAALGVAAAAAAPILVVVAPIDRLVVDAQAVPVVPLLNAETAGILALAGVTVALARREMAEPMTTLGLIVAGALILYAGSIAVVDVFQAQVRDGSTSLEELEKQAQAALSVSWALVGGLALALGLLRRMQAVRLSGLGLLGIATAKVFLVDLATLDVAYRVVSFIGLGILLLGSAWLFFRLQPESRGVGGE